MESVLALLPKKIQSQLLRVPPEILIKCEELRIRVNRPIELIIGGEPHFLSFEVSRQDAEQLLSHLSQFSLYTLEEELKTWIYHDSRWASSRTSWEGDS